ncbi:MAG: hypothetical protein LBB45_03325 [Methanobrevibacter sp.]|nr:hypothetical protein [Candidatus Methanovirga basalitermitum]
MTLTYEELVIEKLNDIKEDQREMKNDLNHKIDHFENEFEKKIDKLDEDNKVLKDSFEKKTDELEDEMRDIKENHLHSIDVRLSKIERDHKWIELFLVILIGLLFKQIFFP